jgi:regulator of sirC expression with transglutaminase-like and TPR domain
MASADPEIILRLQNVGEQNGLTHDIGEAALLLANLELPHNNLGRYLDELDLIVSDTIKAARGTRDLPGRIMALSEILFKRHGYRGDIDSYDDPQNANLMRVIDRRKGLPVALGVLVIHAARSQGWDITGLNFPGHFLLRLTESGEHVVIDPFDEARALGSEDLQQILARVHGPHVKLRPEFIQSVSDRDILLRLQNNIKLRALGDGNWTRAIEVLESMIMIAPMKVDIMAELVSLETSKGHYRSALGRLDLFLEHYPRAENAAAILDLKRNVQSRLN